MMVALALLVLLASGPWEFSVYFQEDVSIWEGCGTWSFMVEAVGVKTSSQPFAKRPTDLQLQMP